ncbi:hydrogenase assembly protein HupF [Rhizobium sp. CG5]|uniref:nickel-dependent hydrogenase large subunit n=1 Tax=Rhizobium sp. CG5 TaxID=2726076 RepID=UPI002033E4D7|nr:nickel-dependent hydrogenase large subunit [Rhizobium sp. CG5]MCM2474432.1 hydrogenase assembly protein HupF [Rhizobium sp. CG5]
MTFALGAGTIRIDVTVSRGQVCAAELSGSRPQGLARMFLGRRPEEAPVLAGQLFSLCGFAQSIAARLAVLRAADRAMGGDERLAAATGLLAERVFETLRALALHWPSHRVSDLAVASGVHLREALAASQSIIAGARAGTLPIHTLALPTARLEGAATSLGIPVVGDIPATGTLCAAILDEIRFERIFRLRRPDSLNLHDDEEVLDHLVRESGYAALPYLAGRVAETGAYARLRASAATDEPYLAARLLARIKDVRLCLNLLQGIADGEERDLAPLFSDGPSPGAGGYGAVECARGRLYHQAEIGSDGSISAYRILAPTEWNFHPAGPFVETLLSCRIGDGEAGRKVVSQLAALFDPCVAFEITVREAAHA